MTTRIPAAFTLLSCLLGVPGVGHAQEQKPIPLPKWTPNAVNTAIGLGGGPTGKYSGRRGGRRKLRASDSSTALSIELGLKWLFLHQDADGKWDADGFGKHDEGSEPTSGAGDAGADLIVTALAVYAMLGDGSSMRAGPYKDYIKRGVKWLRQQQDRAGAFGDKAAASFVHGQALATLAMTEAYLVSNYKTLRRNSQRGLDCLEKFRRPKGGWTSDLDRPETGAIDPSLTVWCTLAYMTARDSRLTFPDRSLEITTTWLQGLVGKNGMLKKIPQDRGPLGTPVVNVSPMLRSADLDATILFSRCYADQKPVEDIGVKLAIASIGAKVPEWKRGSMSHYQWFCASHALHQLGGQPWETWFTAASRTISQKMRHAAEVQGSWDPDGVWGKFGGRVYATAIMTLTLQTPYHYRRFTR
jgi:hypothetical protein